MKDFGSKDASLVLPPNFFGWAPGGPHPLSKRSVTHSVLINYPNCPPSKSPWKGLMTFSQNSSEHPKIRTAAVLSPTWSLRSAARERTSGNTRCSKRAPHLQTRPGLDPNLRSEICRSNPLGALDFPEHLGPKAQNPCVRPPASQIKIDLCTLVLQSDHRTAALSSITNTLR